MGHLWGILKRKVEECEVSNSHQLRDDVMEKWKRTCEALVNSMPKRVKAVLENNGGQQIVKKGMDMVSNNTQVGCGILNDAQLVIRGQKCAKKISPSPLHHHHHSEPLRQGRMDPCFHILYTKL